MPSLREIAQALGGDVVGGNEVLAPGPAHRPHDRSLSVKLSASSPDGFLVHSFAGDDFRDCRDYVAGRLGIGPRGRRAPVTHVSAVPATPSPAARIERALAIWNEAVEPRRTVVERYLNSRRLDLLEDVAGCVIRFHARCPWKDRDSGVTIRVPAMVCAMRSVTMGAITAVHRTRLSPDGQKVDRRMMGVAAGIGFSSIAAVMLDEAGDDLAVGEGVETAMAARQLGVRPAWALGSAGAIAAFPLLSGIRTLRLLAEMNDIASERAIASCGERWCAAGRKVIVIRPSCGKDMNDALWGAA